MSQKFRNVNVNRGWELNDNLDEGLKDAIHTNRTMLALEYLTAIVARQSDRITQLENAVPPSSNNPVVEDVPAAATVKASPAKRTPKVTEENAES